MNAFGHSASGRPHNAGLSMRRSSQSLQSSSSSSSTSSRRERSLNRDIERLFTEKVRIHAHVNSDVSSCMLAVLKMLLKAWLEGIRFSTLSLPAFQQLQLDATALRALYSNRIFRTEPREQNAHHAPAATVANTRTRTASSSFAFVYHQSVFPLTLLVSDDVKVLTSLLEELLSSASDRCVVRASQANASAQAHAHPHAHVGRNAYGQHYPSNDRMQSRSQQHRSRVHSNDGEEERRLEMQYALSALNVQRRRLLEIWEQW